MYCFLAYSFLTFEVGEEHLKTLLNKEQQQTKTYAMGDAL